MSTLPQRTYDYTKYNLKINNLISFQKPVNSGEGETISKLNNGIEKIAIENQISELFFLPSKKLVIIATIGKIIHPGCHK